MHVVNDVPLSQSKPGCAIKGYSGLNQVVQAASVVDSNLLDHFTSYSISLICYSSVEPVISL